MQEAETITVVLAGLFFSFACGLLIEELVFGALFKLFFGHRRQIPKA